MKTFGIILAAGLVGVAVSLLVNYILDCLV